MLKSIKLTDVSAHHVMVTAAAKKILPWSSIGKVQEVWSKEGGDSAWDLYMAMTRPGLRYHIHREMGMITQSRKLILELCYENQQVIQAEADPEGTTEQLLEDGHFAPKDDGVQEEVPEEEAEEPANPQQEEAEDWNLADVF